MRPVIAWKPMAPMPELASVRLRCLHPLEHLRTAGWACELFDPTQVQRYRIVVFQKAYSAEDLDLAADLRVRDVRTVFDLCDNHFYNPSGRPDYRERADRLQRMIDRVDAVTVSTTALANYVNRPSVVVDDALDVVRQDWIGALRRPMRYRRTPLRLVWFGNAGSDDPPFGLIDLARIRPAIESLHRCWPIDLTDILDQRDRDYCIATIRSRWCVGKADVCGAGGR